MNSVYIVFGSTGEYSDRREWAVRGFSDENRAEELVKALDVWLRENRFHEDDDPLAGYQERYHPPPNALDPAFQCDYTGTRYYIVEVPFGG